MMRNDHLAYAQATRVAGFGLLLQLAIGLTLLIFGIVEHDSVFGFASTYALVGSLVWLSLLIIFHQHKLERLEALEEDELAASRGDATSVFDREGEEIRVAARRLRLMHKWLMPIVSLLLAAMLAGFGAGMLLLLSRRDAVGDLAFDFILTNLLGWAIAICLGLTIASFIVSRFVAGMAKQNVWQNLRGGAAWMIGNALVLVAIAVGTTFRYFGNEVVILGVAYAIPIFMLLQAAEILLNFILNLYRPRILGETPRPAFDSKLLSLLAAPDNLVRSINEAVNYQFGFDITSSWGYRLLMRSLAALVGLGAIVLILLNTMVIVEPHEQAIKLAGGRIVGENNEGQIHESGILWKLPWPLQSARVFDVTRVRELPLTAQVIDNTPPGQVALRLWRDELQTDVPFTPFLVGAAPDQRMDFQRLPGVGLSVPAIPAAVQDERSLPTDPLAGDGAQDEQAAELTEQQRQAAERVSRGWSLVDAEVMLLYRIKSRKGGADEEGLIDFLRFAADAHPPRMPFNERQYALQALAQREVIIAFADLQLDEVLGSSRGALSALLRQRVQQAFDEAGTGVEVVDINIPTIRPSGDAVQSWVELSISNQARQEAEATQRNWRVTAEAAIVGSIEVAQIVLQELTALDAMRHKGADAATVEAQQQKIEEMLLRSGGAAARTISAAEADRWVRVMEARGRARRISSEQAAFQAAPELYKQREIMQMWKRVLSRDDARIIVLGIDPLRFHLDVDYKEAAELFSVDAFREYEESN